MAWSYRLNAADEVYANEPGPTVFDPDEAAIIGGGVKIAVLNNVKQLTVGQGFVDVTFEEQPDDQWLFVQAQIINTVDLNAHNLWAGTVTNKTRTGFRLYLNGLPDTVNYFLHWSISVPSLPADTYRLEGPSAGLVGIQSTPFTVGLPPNTFIDSVLVLTPYDGGSGGTFVPTSVFVTTGSPTATFAYTPLTTGTKVISTTNSLGLINPDPLTFNVTVVIYATTYTLIGPTSGRINTPSTNFTVALPGGTTVPSPVIVTPSDGAGGTFTPSTVTLSSATPSATFTYTPSTYGTKTISVTNNSTLTNPSNLSYTSIAATYILTGPSSGRIGVPSSSFHATLPAGGVVIGTVTVTPSDGGAGGTFTPPTVGLTTGAPDATFTYTPALYGTKTISATNNAGLTDPANVVYTSVAATYTFGGPSGGSIGVASTNFTVALPAGGAVLGTVTVTPSAGAGGGTFTPSTVALTTAAPSATFTYTPATTGTKTLNVTNDGGMTNPSNLTYTVAGLVDGDPVSNWVDSSGNGHNATQTGSARPTFKTGIIGGKPVVRFTPGGLSGMNIPSSFSGAKPWSCFFVAKLASATGMWSLSANATGPIANLVSGSLNSCFADETTFFTGSAVLSVGTSYCLITQVTDAALRASYVNGTPDAQTTAAFASAGILNRLGWRESGGTPNYSDGDIAEIIFYNASLSNTLLQNIQKGLSDKYGLGISGGTAIQPNDAAVVANLVAWYKADSLP